MFQKRAWTKPHTRKRWHITRRWKRTQLYQIILRCFDYSFFYIYSALLKHRLETHGTTGSTCPCYMQAKPSYTYTAIPVPLGSFKLFLPALIVFMKFFLESLFSLYFFPSDEGLRSPWQIAIQSTLSYILFTFGFISSSQFHLPLTAWNNSV